MTTTVQSVVSRSSMASSRPQMMNDDDNYRAPGISDYRGNGIGVMGSRVRSDDRVSEPGGHGIETPVSRSRNHGPHSGEIGRAHV